MTITETDHDTLRHSWNVLATQRASVLALHHTATTLGVTRCVVCVREFPCPTVQALTSDPDLAAVETEIERAAASRAELFRLFGVDPDEDDAGVFGSFELNVVTGPEGPLVSILHRTCRIALLQTVLVGDEHDGVKVEIAGRAPRVLMEAFGSKVTQDGINLSQLYHGALSHLAECDHDR